MDDDKKSIDHSTQADMKGDSKLSNNNDTDKDEDEQKQAIEPPIAAKRKVHTVGVGSGHFYRGETSTKNNHYVDLNGTSSNEVKNNMRIITSHNDDKMKKSADHVRPKCCSIS